MHLRLISRSERSLTVFVCLLYFILVSEPRRVRCENWRGSQVSTLGGCNDILLARHILEEYVTKKLSYIVIVKTCNKSIFLCITLNLSPLLHYVSITKLIKSFLIYINKKSIVSISLLKEIRGSIITSIWKDTMMT
jgi:hypothetical protein